MKRRLRLDGLAARRPAEPHCGLVAAYREGLDLAAIAVIALPDGARIRALPSGDKADAGLVHARWWCRRAGDAARLAAAGRARLRRRQASGVRIEQTAQSAELALACSCVRDAAARLGLALQTDDETVAAAMAAAARVEAEIEKLQQAGGLKSVNKAYRSYRIATSGRGERVLRYGEWMRAYKENLVRELAAALRSL